jgi:uncharacterized membrane protein YphA (DoxX/SURF4 family)
MKLIRETARILVGIIFTFSGFVKGIDPLGSTYKFTDYFNAFGAEWATRLSFILAVLLSVSEFAIGVALLFNYRMKIFSWLATIFMAFFLPLTLWVAIKNPVTDCGCFGDALILTNWETFYKNIALMVLTLIIIWQRHHYINRYNINFQNGYFVLILLVFGYLQHHSYHHLPLIDFRPYKIGVNIPEAMEIPDNAPVDVYRTEFIYRDKNSGKTKTFDETNYPWQDTLSWEYVDSKSILLEEGFHPPIKDFTMENTYGEDVKDFYLFDEQYTFILVAYNLEKTSTRKQEKINHLAQQIIDNGMHFVCLTSSTEEQIEAFRRDYHPPYEFLMCDEITLKTMIRSNPGLFMTQSGTILDKWHWKDIPDFDKLKF